MNLSSRISLLNKGWPMVLERFLPGFVNIFQVFKVHVFLSTFSLKLSLNSMLILKMDYKATFKEFFEDDLLFCHINIWVITKFTTIHVKIVCNFRFSMNFVQNYSFF